MANETLNLDNQEWKEYKAKFEKTYQDKEDELKRYQAYLDTKKMIAEHNAKYERGEVTWTMGINQFTDRLSTDHIC